MRLQHYGLFALRIGIQQALPVPRRLFRTRIATLAIHRVVDTNRINGSSLVSAALFADLMHQCGISEKRLRADLYPLEKGHCARPHEFPLAVAVSGGADSMALMLLLREYLQLRCIQTPLLAVTVDHRLRPESSAEAREVSTICAAREGIRHITRVCDWQCEEMELHAGDERVVAMDTARPTRPHESKMEEHARRYRYDLLRQVCIEYRVQCLFVAHNRGDQLETTLFRLGRASGVNGLAGIARQLPLFPAAHLSRCSRDWPALATNEMTTVVRPLLSVTKDQLMATCGRFQQTWIHDPSNDDPTYDRVRVRQALKRIEEERGAAILDLFARFQQTAETAKHEFARLEQRVLHKYTVLWQSDVVVVHMAMVRDPDVFDELLYRVLSRIIVHVGNKEAPPRLASVARLARALRSLESGKQLTLGGCRIVRIAKRSNQLEFQPERWTKK
ncbi:unnamed protein product [Hyaloperonospora brassicae]|uniref:tRNA(Ile)-lysidine synthetase n=1 Tax=Hyaloperonospora brassicae TaxID=162125 RepID=A0AAV0UWG5_HYABA|nr:unnamed protein product [Hyaloperonospora brassicae]